MHSEVEKFLNNIPACQKYEIKDIDTHINYWRIHGKIIACEFLLGPLKGRTTINYDDKYYNEEEFYRVLKLKVFW